MLRSVWCLAILGVLACPLAGQADLLVSVGDLQLQEGGTGFVDVTVAGAGDLMQAFGLDLRIQTTGASWLQFVTPQPADYVSLGEYVFAGDSYLLANPPTPFATPGESVVAGDTLIGGDFTDSFNDVKVTGAKLLARLQVTADTALRPSVGDIFTITVAPSSSTSFTDGNFAAVPFTCTSGTVTITAVPESGTLALLAAGGVAGMLYTLRYRRHRFQI